MKRQPTPDILGALLGGTPTPVYRPAPSPAPARELLRTWQTGDADEQAATLTAIQPPPPSPWAALSPTLSRLAARLAARAGDTGVLWLPEAECAAVFGTGSHGTQRNQLSELKRAGILIYAHEGGWFVRFAVQDYTNIVQNRTNIVQDYTTGQNGIVQDYTNSVQNRTIAPNNSRAEPHDTVQDYTNSVQDYTNIVQNRTIPPTTNKQAVCMIDPDLDPISSNQTNTPAPEPPFVPNPDEAHTAKGLLLDIGVIPVTADLIVARRSLFEVRRVIGYWLEHKQAVGGQLRNTPGFVVDSLNYPGKNGIPARISPNFLHSDLHRAHLTAAERAEYEAVDETPEPAPLVRVRDEDAQGEPPADAPTGFDPAALWREFAARSERFTGTRLTAYDSETGEITVEAPADALSWLVTPAAASAVRRQASPLFGRAVFVKFEQQA